jgi:lambda family phage minor tail protein L
MTTPQSITSEIQKLEPSAIIELFVLDASAFGGDVLRFHAGTNGLRQNLVWQGNTYTAFPVQASGFDMSGNGQLPRPKLQVANITGAISLLVLTYDDMLGAKITRKRTLVKYLDAVNFPGGTNPTADSTAEFADDVFENHQAGKTQTVAETVPESPVNTGNGTG